MEKSKGHIAFIGNHEYYLSDTGDLYRAHVGNVIASDTQRRHGRFEAPAHMVDKHPLIKKGGGEMKYVGIVKDRLQGLETRKTRKYNTYKEAHDAAEKLCRRTMGERGTIDVMIVNGD